jgi:hypothetical protein
VKWSNNPSENLWGVMLLGEGEREAPAQAELRPSCAGSFRVNLHLILALKGDRPPRVAPRSIGLKTEQKA